MSKIKFLINWLPLPITVISSEIYGEMVTEHYTVLGAPCPRAYFSINHLTVVNRKDLIECASFYQNRLWSWAISDQDYSEEL